MVGDVEERGRLPGSTRLATGRPNWSGRKEKSVSSLFSRKPRTITRAPNASSIVVVSETALPAASSDDDVAGAASGSASCGARLPNCLARVARGGRRHGAFAPR